jgi:hypothetical protein
MLAWAYGLQPYGGGLGASSAPLTEPDPLARMDGPRRALGEPRGDLSLEDRMTWTTGSPSGPGTTTGAGLPPPPSPAHPTIPTQQ